jgi:putative ABC transport system substrate-binding protein
MITRRAFLCGLSLGTLSAPLAAGAQPAAKIPRIGVFGTVSSESPAAYLFVELRQGLRDLGYIEGQNIAIEWRDLRGDARRFQPYADELVRLNVDVIVAAASATAAVAKRATSTIPIVMMSGDPIGEGLVNSLARPGGNVTGLSTLAPEVVGKQLELLKQALPRFSRVAILWNPGNPFHAANVKEAEAATKALGAQPQIVAVRTPGDLDRAFAEMTKAQAGALLVLADAPVFVNSRARIADLAARSRLPAMYPRRDHVEAGGLMAYGTDRRQLFRRLATYVDKILKGAKPADLPVEQPTKFELVLNLKTAKALGLTIPPSILARADQVIE